MLGSSGWSKLKEESMSNDNLAITDPGENSLRVNGTVEFLDVICPKCYAIGTFSSIGREGKDGRCTKCGCVGRMKDEENINTASGLRGIGFEMPKTLITFSAAAPDGEMLRIANDGFYVRGVKLPQDENEAKAVYDAFIAWMGKQ
jgi:hypothetical protein